MTVLLILNQRVASEESFALACSRITTDVKTKVLKVENTNLRMLIDTDSRLSIVDKNSFEKVAEKNKNIRLKLSKTNIYPCASEALVTKRYFMCKFETPNKIGIQKCYVVNKDKVGIFLCQSCENPNQGASKPVEKKIKTKKQVVKNKKTEFQ